MGEYNVRYCDRCNKEMRYKSGFLSHKWIFKWSLLGVYEKDTYELCKDCADELNAFLKNPKVNDKRCFNCLHHEGATRCGLLKAQDGRAMVFYDFDSCSQFTPKVVEK